MLLIWGVVILFGSLLVKSKAFEFEISYADFPDQGDGRVRLYFSRVPEDGDCTKISEPRSSCDDTQNTSQVFGVDAEKGGVAVAVNDSTLGYPLYSLNDLTPGLYCIQADLFPYTTYHRGDGFNLTLPKSCVSDAGNDGRYNAPAGTLYSDVQMLKWPQDKTTIKLIHQEPIPKSPGCSGLGHDTEWIKTVKIQSELLSKFWGQDMLLEACVLLPAGFYDRNDTKYPLVIAHGHYSAIFNPGGRFDFRKPTKNITGYARYDQEAANWFASNWSSLESDGVFSNARALVVTINHPVPFFDDSYAVDSVNVGPYGSAIWSELVPFIENKFRGLGEGWARGVLGGSTGGWESLAYAVFYPEKINYAAIACPDPVTFTQFVTTNIYRDNNMFYYNSPFKRTLKPGTRDSYSGQDVLPGTSIPTYGRAYGDTTATIEEMSRREIVLGHHSRSCGQWDIWEAVFGPQDASSGYPARLWCKNPKSSDCEYGKIDHEIAKYWQENFDLRYIMERDWKARLGNDLKGKLHIFVGASDTFFLTDAVMDLQDFLQSDNLDPPFEGTLEIGTHDGRGYNHCFNGYLPDGTPAPNSVTREMYVSKFLPLMAKRWKETAPEGADLSWMY